MTDPIVARLIDAGRRRPEADHQAIHRATLRAERAETPVAGATLVASLLSRLAISLAPTVRVTDPACCVA